MTAVNKYQYKMEKFELKLIFCINQDDFMCRQSMLIFISDDIADFIKATLSAFLLHYRVH